MFCAVLGALFVYSELLICVLLRGGLAVGLVFVGLMVSVMAVLAWTWRVSVLSPDDKYLLVAAK